jgi:hypothetical protein
MATTDAPTDAPSRPYEKGDISDLPREERRELYDRLLGIVEAQASPKQLPWTRRVIVRRLACDALPCWYDTIVKLLDDLVDRDHLLEWSDTDDYRVVCRAEPATLARVHHVLGGDGYDRPRLRSYVLAQLEARRE